MAKVIGGLRVKKGSALSHRRRMADEKQAEAEKRGKRISSKIEQSKRAYSPGTPQKSGHGFEAISKQYQKRQAENAMSVHETRLAQGRPGLRPHQLRIARSKAGM